MKKIILFLFFAIWTFLANAQSMVMYLPARYYNDQPGPFYQVLDIPVMTVTCGDPDDDDKYPLNSSQYNKNLKRKDQSGNYTSICMQIINILDMNGSGSIGDCIVPYPGDPCKPDYADISGDNGCTEMSAWAIHDVEIGTLVTLDPNHLYVNGDHIHIEAELKKILWLGTMIIGTSHCWDLTFDLYFVDPSVTLDCHCLTGTHDIKAYESISFTTGFCYYASGSDYMSAHIGESGPAINCNAEKSAVLYPTSTSDNDDDNVIPNLALASFPIETTAFSVYPNPTTGMVEISSNTILIQSIEIISPTGLQLYNVNNLNTLSKDIDLTSYPDGLYIVRIKTDEGIVTKKIVKTQD